MKCHSSNTTQLSSVTRNSQTYTPTDVSLDFNPGNYSSHNVLGQSVGGWNTFDVVPDSGGGTVTVTWPLPTVNVFVSGYDWNTKLTCTSCHTNQATPSTEAKGPHGSGVEWALDPAYSGDWRTAGLSSGSANGMAYSDGTAATDIICAKCHDLYGTSSGEDGWSNTAHNKSGHWVTHRDPKYCTNCHSGIPHGMSRPRMIGYTDDTAPYGSSNGGSSYGLVEIAASSRSLNSGAVTWGCSHCKTSSGRHPSDISASWP
jgi:hypothetical protein